MNINGKLSLLLMLFVYLGCHGAQKELSIRATSMSGATLINAAVGEPFLIEVILQNAASQINTPQIAHDGVHVPRYCGFKMSSVNGKTSVAYQYQMRIDEPGEFTLGPAKIVDNQKVMISDPLKLKVTAQATVPEQKKNRSHRQVKEPFMRLTSDIKDAVVGQKVTVSAAFYYQAGKQELVQIHESDDLDGIKSSRVKNGPYQGITSIDGTEYQFLMYTWDVYPTQEGNVVIPALGADYSNVPDRDDFFGAFASLLNRATALKRLYSNALTLQVNSLPTHAKDAQAIGTFSSLHASMNPSVAKIGQGMTYTLTLEGDGNFEFVPTPQLVNMPEGCKWYESKKIIPRDKEASKVEFEYVIQGIKVGDWTIPEQSITYYDTTTHRLAKITSEPIMITILSDASKTTASSNQVIGEAVDFEQTIELVPQQQLVVPIKQYGPIHYVPALYIPWHIYFWIIYALFLLALAYYFYRLTWGKPTIASQLHTIQSKIKSISEQDRVHLYHAMRRAVAHVCNCNEQDITHERIRECIAHTGISELQQQAFIDFWQSLEQDQYYQSRNFDQLKKIATEWLSILAKSKLAQKSLVLVLALFTITCSAINIQETFLQANLLMDAHNYDKALELYQSIPKKGYSVLYNSAIAYYQKANYPNAAAYAYQAQQIANSYERYSQAQLLVNQSLDKLQVADDKAVLEKLYSWVLPLHVLFMQLLFLLLCISIIWLLFNRRTWKLLAALCLVTIYIYIVLYANYYHATFKKAFLLQEAPLLTVPTAGVDQIGLLAKGTPVAIVDTKAEWVKVRNKNLVGWVLNDTLTAVEK